MSTQAIHDDLVATRGAEAPAYSTVTKYLPTTRFDPAKDPRNSDSSSPQLKDSDKVVLAVLEQNRFRQCGSLHEPSIFHA
jgi:hypothetical protein